MATEQPSGRRVVVGRDSGGKSAVIWDDDSPEWVQNSTYSGVAGRTIWKDTHDIRLADDRDQLAVWTHIPIATGGTRFYMVSIAPHAEVPAHMTPTIEYHYVIAGEIIAVLDESEVKVRIGDLLIMRGVAHGWRNDSDDMFLSVATQVSVDTSAA